MFYSPLGKALEKQTKEIDNHGLKFSESSKKEIPSIKNLIPEKSEIHKFWMK